MQKEPECFSHLFNHVSEKYIGMVTCQDNDAPQLSNLKEFRVFRIKHFDTILKRLINSLK